MEKEKAIKILKSLIDEHGFTPKMNGFPRYIGKSGYILVSAYGSADLNNQKLMLKRFPDINRILEMCRSNIKEGFCRVVTGAYLMGLSASEIEEGCKEIGIWIEKSDLPMLG